jgi:fermentation-respiration switch protein FrsA (DUF1100 family)
MICGSNHLQIVLYDHQGISELDQATQGLKEPLCVSIMEADSGLIEYVNGARESGAQLGSQADSLGLTAAELVGGSVQTQVVEADILQEAKAITKLSDGLGGDNTGRLSQLEVLPEAARLSDSHGGDLVDALSTDGGPSHLWFESCALASGTQNLPTNPGILTLPGVDDATDSLPVSSLMDLAACSSPTPLIVNLQRLIETMQQGLS